MLAIEKDENPKRCGPRTTTVLIFLAAFAMIASWLSCYAVTNALVAADVINAWPHEADPRPRWMLNSFVGFLLAFGLIGGAFRWLSNRQLRRIDDMANADER
jgi:hypothetical protein